MAVLVVTKGSGQLDLGGFHRCSKSQGQTEKAQRVWQLLRWLLPSSLTILPANLQSGQEQGLWFLRISISLILIRLSPTLLFLALDPLLYTPLPFNCFFCKYRFVQCYLYGKFDNGTTAEFCHSGANQKYKPSSLGEGDKNKTKTLLCLIIILSFVYLIFLPPPIQ